MSESRARAFADAVTNEPLPAGIASWFGDAIGIPLLIALSRTQVKAGRQSWYFGVYSFVVSMRGVVTDGRIWHREFLMNGDTPHDIPIRDVAEEFCAMVMESPYAGEDTDAKHMIVVGLLMTRLKQQIDRCE